MEIQTKMRIYVGGLGETVTEQDLRNTFSKSGTVEAVEFVETKGRSFAYIDFLPSSDKSVAKLFSTYNGCAWKGGKLRLEKAKLHYLERLKREWAEDTDLESKTQDDGDAMNMVSSVGEEEPLDESSQIHMFFPRLRKVKSLPYKGSGKHKYSFQRIEASVYPVHFCDCAEHAGKINTTHIHHTSMKDGGMNEDEINMMNSVLNKFLRREVAPSNHLPDDQNHIGDSTDDDNIIINAVAGPDDVTQLLESMKKQTTGLQIKMARSKKLQSQSNIRIQKGKDKNPRKKGKLAQVKGSDKEVEFPIPNRKQTWINQSERQLESLNTEEKSGRKQYIGNTSLSLSKPAASNNVSQPELGADDLPNGDSKAASVSNVEQLNEAADTDPKKVASDKSTRSMSWMKLVSSANNSPFSLSQILPETNVSKKSTQISSGLRTGINKNSINPAFKRKRENTYQGLDFGKGKWMTTTSEDIIMQGNGKKRQKLDIQQSAAPEGNLLAKANDSNENNCASTSGSKPSSQEKKAFSSDLQISDTCPFMRTDSSVKDWVKTKTALSASLKKKK